jgi:D-arabinose 1-dehydrogenase-like Zn-dependent alcohol dehydrogenase
MRAVLANNREKGAGKLYIGEVETPEPENEQVLVKVWVAVMPWEQRTDYFIDPGLWAQSNGYPVCPFLKKCAICTDTL